MTSKYLQKRKNSLDLSNSEESDYGKSSSKYNYDSSKKDLRSSGGSYQSYASPSHNSPNKLPKSILKDSSGKKHKPKNRIKINELMNETHSINNQNSKRSLNSDKVNLETKARETASFKNYDKRSKESLGDSLSSGKDSKTKEKAQGNNSFDSSSDDMEISQNRLKNLYRKEIENLRDGSDSDDLESIGNYAKKLTTKTKPDEYEREKIRNSQKNREQELFSKVVKDSAEKVRQKWIEEKSKLHDDELIIQPKDILDSKLHRSQPTEPKGETYSKIESKLDRLEKDIYQYSKATDKAEEKVENIEKDHRLISEKFNKLKKDLDDSFERRKEKQLESDLNKDIIKNSSTKFKETKDIIPSSDKKIFKKTKTKNHSVNNLSPRNYVPSSVPANDEIFNEIKKLKEENEQLKQKLKIKDTHYKHSPDAERYGIYDIDLNTKVEKEKELLKMIDKIKNKLKHSIAKKLLKDQEKQVKDIKGEAEMKTLIKNSKTYADSKTTFNRKIYGPPKVTRETSYLLYKGLPTAYNSHNWKINQSLKLEKKKIIE